MHTHSSVAYSASDLYVCARARARAHTHTHTHISVAHCLLSHTVRSIFFVTPWLIGALNGVQRLTGDNACVWAYWKCNHLSCKHDLFYTVQSKNVGNTFQLNFWFKLITYSTATEITRPIDLRKSRVQRPKTSLGNLHPTHFKATFFCKRNNNSTVLRN
jgi:hypothetical protein